MKPRSMTVCSASPMSGSDFPTMPMSTARRAGEASSRLTSTKTRPPASCMGRAAVSCRTETPSGFMASVIICWWPTEM